MSRLASKPDEVSYPRKASGPRISRSTMPASTSNTRVGAVSAPRHTLLPMAFRIIPINRITREMTHSSTVIPTRPKIALRARQVIQKALMNGSHDETIEMALTKLLSNFNYLWGWGGYKDKSVGVTVGLLNEMLAVLKEDRLEGGGSNLSAVTYRSYLGRGHALYVIAYTLGFPDVGFPVGRILHLHFSATGFGLHHMYSAFVWYAPELTALSIQGSPAYLYLYLYSRACTTKGPSQPTKNMCEETKGSRHGEPRQIYSSFVNSIEGHEETLQLFEKQPNLKRGW
ncbi:uncharacterized protein B0T23DRAFT_399969 [Neurospora hispaniola]|uniref:Uncharacterized protein n=1 Tax=Neurospora hispaniola TaxID=588809 RepID=A0AAJ0HZ46_9PEZI|nr:hypothetical protein B0T23DRAFT_399969 [Neurospora hispaniola]